MKEQHYITTLQGNKYIIDTILGSGGFGNTYLATHAVLGRKVAIKEFFMKEYCDRDYTTSQVIVHTNSSRLIVERYKQKFLKEAQMIASLKNEHIIQIHDIFEENGTAYYVMEYVDGGSLKDKVESEGAMSEAAAIDYIRQIADALSYLHKHSILHLDIKPANILVDKDNKAILIDFGISKHYDSDGGQTSTTPAGVSKGYAPIEQYQQGSISGFSPSTDMYSLGATLYFLLTGETPPEASIVYEDGLPAKVFTFSKSIQNVVTTSMSPRRKDRFQSMEDLLKALPNNSALATDGGNTGSKVLNEETTIIIQPSVNNVSSTNEEIPQDNKTKSNGYMKYVIAIIVIGLVIFGAIRVYRAGVEDSNSKPVETKTVVKSEAKISFDNGYNSTSLTFDSNAHKVQTLKITKNFSDVITATNVPNWVIYAYSENPDRIMIECRENTGGAREATIYLHKKGDDGKNPSAQIKIKQTAGTNQSSSGQQQVSFKASKLFLPEKATLEGEVGKTLYLKHEIVPIEAQNNKIIWTSSNKNVATVKTDGAIIAQGNGTTTITATVDNISRECKLEVRIQSKPSQSSSAAEMSLVPSSLSLNVGESSTLTASNYGPSLTWESENPKVATVSANGKVVAVGPGKTTIWAKGDKYKMCTVNVRAQESSSTSTNQSNKAYQSVPLASNLQLSVPGSNVVRWESDNSGVAPVNDNGLVYGKAVGKTTIWAHLANGELKMFNITVY